MSQIETKRAGETRNAAISFANQLDTSETMSGSPTLSSSPTGLSFAAGAVTTAATTINGVSVGTGRAVTFRVSGGTDGVMYTITCVVPSTSLSQASLEAEVLLEVRG